MQAFLFLFYLWKIKFRKRLNTLYRIIHQRRLEPAGGSRNFWFHHCVCHCLTLACLQRINWKEPEAVHKDFSELLPFSPVFLFGVCEQPHFHTSFLLDLEKSLLPFGPSFHRRRMFEGQLPLNRRLIFQDLGCIV